MHILEKLVKTMVSSPITFVRNSIISDIFYYTKYSSSDISDEAQS